MADLRADEFYLGATPDVNLPTQPDDVYDWPLLRQLTGEPVATIRLTTRDATLLCEALEAAAAWTELLAVANTREADHG